MNNQSRLKITSRHFCSFDKAKYEHACDIFFNPFHRISLLSSIPVCAGFSIETSSPPGRKYQWFCDGDGTGCPGIFVDGHTNGLYKYDGHHYSYYLHQTLNQNSPALNYIECINIDKAGNIWLGTRGCRS